MNNGRQILCARQPQLSSEDFGLLFARRMVVIKCKSDLAPRDHALALPNQTHQALLSRLIEQLRIMRMDPDGCINGLMLLSQLNRTFEHAAMRIARANVEHGSDAGIMRSGDHLFAIGVEFKAVNVAM